jgi:hypothetical protein
MNRKFQNIHVVTYKNKAYFFNKYLLSNANFLFSPNQNENLFFNTL